MKIVEDYMNFDSYKSITDQSVYPIFKNAVDEAFNDVDSINKMKKYKKIAIILLIISIATFLLGIILLFATASTGSSSNVIVFIIFSVIALILGGVTIFFYIKFRKILNAIMSKIRNAINVEKIYNESFKKVNNGIDYLSVKENIESLLKSNRFTAKDIVENSLTMKEVRSYNFGVPSDAQLIKKSNKKYLLIDDRYPASFMNVVYLEIVRNSKGEVTSKRYYNRGVLKIDTRSLGHKGFAFTLFKRGFFSNKPLKLENPQFNKIVKLYSEDELKARQMYTPLSMELSVKRAKDTNGSVVNSMYVTSTGDSIYFEYSVPMSFMELDIASSTKKEKILDSMYKDFLYDTYTLYWILSIIYIPIYLDK
ncbi:DUF3137 domain-containing protein [Mycoplasma sp. OR1901]|uniref:DUF3137 domain-containing protein n=1 Tax=Mycoplasma sp. OR1901 TaxID=2742195 RepID=UPI001582931B|nr:DUF3137 domain-containing protein [Mycoplasma sp. OR1901]QKT05340.1 DUF3137 domain-containing protein [Mycoplasma sp. OR1901]